MRRRIVVRAGCAVLLVAALAACEEAEGVDVQPLPPLKRPSPEARAGLPEVAGAWRFAGWELPVSDTATRGAGMLPPGAFLVRTQRLDSIAGDYEREGARYPFVGEVRRDGTFSVAAFGPDGSGSFAAGKVVRDTLWLELTSLSVAATWSSGARAALVRTRPAPAPFVRYQGGFVLRPPVDSVKLADSVRMADSLRRADSLRALAPVPPGSVAPVPGQPVPGAPGAVVPGQPVPARPGVQAPAARPQPRAPRPAPVRPRPRQETPKRETPRETVEPPREREREEETPRPPPPDTSRPRPVIVP